MDAVSRTLLITLVATALTACGANSGGPTAGGGTTNPPPNASPDIATVAINSAGNSIAVLANDSSPTGTALRVVSASVSSTTPADQPGTVLVDSAGAHLLFTPPQGFSGTQIVRYTISDGFDHTATSVVAITVSPVGLPPNAMPDVFTVSSDSQSNLIDVLSNDISGSGSTLELIDVQSLVTVPGGLNGTVFIDGNRLNYSPAAGFLGTESLVYTLSDQEGQTSSTTVIVTVLPLATQPIATPDVFTVASNSSGNVLNVLANDFDLSGSGLLISAVSSISSLPTGSAGSFSIFGEQVVYRPATGFVGAEYARYTVTTGDGASAVGAIAIVVGTPDLSVPPIVVPDVFNVVVDSSDNTLNVLTNDIDPAGGGLTLTDASSTATIPLGTTGTLSIAGNAIHYSPAPGFIGAETLSYEVTDTNGTSSTGAVAVSVLPTDIPPIGLPDIAVVEQNSTDNAIDVLANDIDLSATGLSISAVSSVATLPAGSTGSFSINGGVVEYSPEPGFLGVETAVYTLTTGAGISTQGTISVAVVAALNPDFLPVAVPDAVTVPQDSGATLVDATSNDVDPYGNGLTVTDVQVALSVPNAAHTAGISGNEVTFTPAPGFAGIVTLTYTISDGVSEVLGTIAVTVTPTALIAPPVALPDAYVMNQGDGVQLFDVISNDLSPSGDPLSLTAINLVESLPPAAHAFSINGNQLQFEAPADFSGIVSLTYTINDGTSDAIGTATITVSPIALTTTPVALPDAFVIDQGDGAQLFDVIANDLSPSGDPLSLTAISVIASLPAAAHTLSINADQLQFEAPADFAGVVTVSYTISDGTSTADGLASITVNPLALAALPLALPDVDTATSLLATPQSFDTLANDLDPAGGGLTLTNASITASVPLNVLIPNPGAVAVAANQVEYTPTAGFTGTVTITYTGEDVNGQALVGILTLTVAPL